MMFDNSTRRFSETKEQGQNDEPGLRCHEQPAKPTQLDELLPNACPKPKECADRDGQPQQRNEAEETKSRTPRELVNRITTTCDNCL